jgi:hypothetical protein
MSTDGAAPRAEVSSRTVDKGTLIFLGTIGAFVALFIALGIARVLMGYVLSRQKTQRRGY